MKMIARTLVIIGGGPGGLTLARLLERKGIDYIVYERDQSEETNRNAGGSLDLHPKTGQLALREAGLFDEFKKYARWDDTKFTVADKLGKRFLEIGQGRDAPEIDRSQLRQILLDSIPKDKIKWGHTLKSVTIGDDSRPVLQFGNGEVVSGFKLVVGADGGWSKVRSMVRCCHILQPNVPSHWPFVQVTQATPRYTGKSFLISTIEHDSPLYEKIANKVGAGTNLSIGSGKYILIQRQGNGSYRIFFGLQVQENFFRDGTVDIQDIEAIRSLFASDFFADWSEEYKDIIRYATDFHAWPLYTLATEDMGWKSVPGVTVAGDAAHLGYPGGKGVNLAMTDALELTSKIVEHGVENLEQAIKEYEADMFPRGISAIAEGNVMTDVMYSEDPQAFLKVISGEFWLWRLVLKPFLDI
jgi:2-polyprenyl-6-methoxyphenol hydroxylase-like FAD-dependent oxidoreductase